MYVRALTFLVVTVFILFAVFGLYVPFMGGMDHVAGCPFAPGGTSLCGMTLAHIQHWQSAFAATLVYLLALCVAALLLIARVHPRRIGDPHYERYRARTRVPTRPTLFQELFARGILHRKEPHAQLL